MTRRGGSLISLLVIVILSISCGIRSETPTPAAAPVEATISQETEAARFWLVSCGEPHPASRQNVIASGNEATRFPNQENKASIVYGIPFGKTTIYSAASITGVTYRSQICITDQTLSAGDLIIFINPLGELWTLGRVIEFDHYSVTLFVFDEPQQLTKQ